MTPCSCKRHPWPFGAALVLIGTRDWPPILQARSSTMRPCDHATRTRKAIPRWSNRALTCIRLCFISTRLPWGKAVLLVCVCWILAALRGYFGKVRWLPHRPYDQCLRTTLSKELRKRPRKRNKCHFVFLPLGALRCYSNPPQWTLMMRRLIK